MEKHITKSEARLLRWLGGFFFLKKSKPICQAGDAGSIPGLGKFPGEGNGNSLQYSCLGNSTDREFWQAAVKGITKNRTQFRD